MTATPAVTTPLDLAFTARLMGLDKDFQKTKINMNDIRNQVAAARKEDREAQREAGDIIMHTLGDNQKSAYRRAVTMIMEKLHILFAGHIIYRTHRSRDLSGKLINGLPPYVERSLAIRPNTIDCEFNDMLRQRLGDDIEKKKKSRKRVSPALGQHFYVQSRTGSIHPSCVYPDTFPSPKFRSKDKWKMDPPAKLDALLETVLHCLRKDNAPPLMTDEEGNLKPDPGYTPEPRPDDLTEPDKIVIFSPFPMHNMLIRKLLRLYGIECIEINGTMSLKKRAENLAKFMNSDANGPRVLLVSNIGTVGLNIDKANILIFFGSQWSDMDSRQMIGRIWRQPQRKIVIIYWILTRGSADVFLDSISLEKGFMHDALMKDPSVRQTAQAIDALNNACGDKDDNDNDEQSDDDEEPDQEVLMQTASKESAANRPTRRRPKARKAEPSSAPDTPSSSAPEPRKKPKNLTIRRTCKTKTSQESAKLAPITHDVEMVDTPSTGPVPPPPPSSESSSGSMPQSHSSSKNGPSAALKHTPAHSPSPAFSLAPSPSPVPPHPSTQPSTPEPSPMLENNDNPSPEETCSPEGVQTVPSYVEHQTAPDVTMTETFVNPQLLSHDTSSLDTELRVANAPVQRTNATQVPNDNEESHGVTHTNSASSKEGRLPPHVASQSQSSNNAMYTGENLCNGPSMIENTMPITEMSAPRLDSLGEVSSGINSEHSARSSSATPKVAIPDVAIPDVAIPDVATLDVATPDVEMQDLTRPHDSHDDDTEYSPGRHTSPAAPLSPAVSLSQLGPAFEEIGGLPNSSSGPSASQPISQPVSQSPSQPPSQPLSQPPSQTRLQMEDSRASSRDIHAVSKRPVTGGLSLPCPKPIMPQSSSSPPATPDAETEVSLTSIWNDIEEEEELPNADQNEPGPSSARATSTRPPNKGKPNSYKTGREGRTSKNAKGLHTSPMRPAKKRQIQDTESPPRAMRRPPARVQKDRVNPADAIGSDSDDDDRASGAPEDFAPSAPEPARPQVRRVQMRGA
ncbi:hypothetical protein NM688_g8374 [Phlebia brevispora]|uniref:Uncharacterized protein n=1 Tax=Phlebia brevispora TaxID=194682 RepID=A0ACC1RUL6_9APHY|nr:hypothetical protein NM688_g8374 [Phlebia brevispora]